MDRIKKRYPLNPAQKKIIKSYEKVTSGELAHIALTKVSKDLRIVFKIEDLYITALKDDCTRLTYAEILKDKRTSSLTYFMTRALSWFKQIYNFEFEKVLSDNATECKGSLIKEHPLETTCQ